MESRGLAHLLIQCFTGSLSIIGSSSIICMIVLDRENKLIKPNHRLMLMMSIFDVLSSAAIATSTFAFPKNSSVHGAIGNVTTCRVQFFFATLGLAIPMYNASLSLLYLLSIRHRISLTHFATKIEPYLHAVSILAPLTIAIVSISKDEVSASHYDFVCTAKYGASMTWLFIAVPFFSLLISVYAMVMVSHTVWSQSNKMKSYSYSTTQLQRRNAERKATIKQAILYTSAFVITFLFPALILFLGNGPILTILKSIFYPLQGFWNFLLYIRPLVAKKKKENNDENLVKIIWNVIFHSHEINEEAGQTRLQNRPTAGQTRLQNRPTVIKRMKMKREESEESKVEIDDESVKPITSENQNEKVPDCDENNECNRSAKPHTTLSPLFCKNGDDNLETPKQVRRESASSTPLVSPNDHDDTIETPKQDRRTSRRGSDFFFVSIVDDDSVNFNGIKDSDEEM